MGLLGEAAQTHGSVQSDVVVAVGAAVAIVGSAAMAASVASRMPFFLAQVGGGVGQLAASVVVWLGGRLAGGDLGTGLRVGSILPLLGGIANLSGRGVEPGPIRDGLNQLGALSPYAAGRWD